MLENGLPFNALKTIFVLQKIPIKRLQIHFEKLVAI